MTDITPDAPLTLQFDAITGLAPAIVQDATSGQVLMLGYLNAEAWKKTQQEGRVTFFSRSKNRLWTKGESSGNFLTVVSAHIDCDADTVLLLVHPAGPTCHRGSTSCFEQPNQAVSPEPDLTFLASLERTIEARKENPVAHAGSYTVSLFAAGVPKIAQKVGEEAVETVIDAVAGHRTSLPGEVADLLYHLLVLLSATGVPLAEVLATLRQRHGAPRRHSA